MFVNAYLLWRSHSPAHYWEYFLLFLFWRDFKVLGKNKLSFFQKQHELFLTESYDILKPYEFGLNDCVF